MRKMIQPQSVFFRFVLALLGVKSVPKVCFSKKYKHSVGLDSGEDTVPRYSSFLRYSRDFSEA